MSPLALAATLAFPHHHHHWWGAHCERTCAQTHIFVYLLYDILHTMYRVTNLSTSVRSNVIQCPTITLQSLSCSAFEVLIQLCGTTLQCIYGQEGDGTLLELLVIIRILFHDVYHIGQQHSTTFDGVFPLSAIPSPGLYAGHGLSWDATQTAPKVRRGLGRLTRTPMHF